MSEPTTVYVLTEVGTDYDDYPLGSATIVAVTTSKDRADEWKDWRTTPSRTSRRAHPVVLDA